MVPIIFSNVGRANTVVDIAIVVKLNHLSGHINSNFIRTETHDNLLCCS